MFSCDGMEDPFVAALDRATGDVHWKQPRNTTAAKTFSFSTPTEIEVDGSKQIISAGSGFVAAYDPADGREIWRVRYGEGYSVVPRPVFANGLLFVASGFERPYFTPSIQKALAATRRKPTSSGRSTGRTAHTLGACRWRRTLLCLRQWRRDLPRRTYQENSLDEAPWRRLLRVTAACRRPHLLPKRSRRDDRRESRNEFESLAVNDIGERTLASPIAVDGAIFIRSESHLWRIGK